jgi:mono/diheme cytochrome c family protein
MSSIDAVARAMTGVVLAWSLAIACTPAESGTMTAQSSIERGKYLVNISGCHDCHSPKVYTDHGPVPDTTRLLSGQPADEAVPEVPVDILGPGKWAVMTNDHFTAWVGAWGVSFAANLTPDPTGLQAWTKEMFIQALRTGKHMGQGRPILPPMPWPGFAQMTDEDLGAIYDYLRSLKPVHNPVPQPVPPPGA